MWSWPAVVLVVVGLSMVVGLLALSSVVVVVVVVVTVVGTALVVVGRCWAPWCQWLEVWAPSLALPPLVLCLLCW